MLIQAYNYKFVRVDEIIDSFFLNIFIVNIILM